MSCGAGCFWFSFFFLCVCVFCCLFSFLFKRENEDDEMLKFANSFSVQTGCDVHPCFSTLFLAPGSSVWSFLAGVTVPSKRNRDERP